EAELARAREEIAAAEEAQGKSAAHASERRERAAALSAERDAEAARLGMLDQDGERARVAREEMLARIGSLAQQTRASHAHVEGLRHGVSDLDAKLDMARRERESLVDRQTQLESDVRMAEVEERDAAGG